ncbi:MAG: hypothetical protein Q4A66_01555 [Eubacteriales bacterium]|nr:hypothetical protein [Eubacteriales bacterium]
MREQTIRTTSFSVANYCRACCCRCAHCLLDSEFRATGVEHARAEALARRLFAECAAARPELRVIFYAGYCMDLPEIERYVRFTGTPFLQCNGMALRGEREAEEWMRRVGSAGVRTIDCTFYGTQESHDAFAARKGDFAYLLRLIRAAQAAEIDAQASIALTKSNMEQMPALFEQLNALGVREKYVFLSHAKGRGIELTGQRLTQEEFDALCPQAKAHFSALEHRTEADWIRSGDFPQAQARNVTLVCTPENIERYERMDAQAVLAELEEMDERFYAALPSPAELAALVGKAENRQIFRWRDLYLEWQKRYLARYAPELYDMNDERHSFSVRMYAERKTAK